jgi:membrane associated rhomboid family serine protease
MCLRFGLMAPELSDIVVNGPFPEGSVDAGVYPTHAAGFEHSLVVLAMGEACWLIAADDGHHLRVEPAVLDAARQQLACFDRESVGWPPPPVGDTMPAIQHVPLSPLLWVLAVFAVFWAQGRWPGLTDAGLLDASRVFEHGEWWRAGSALWLHGDLGHLVSNAGGGFLVFSAVVATFGLNAGWSWLTASALLGNVAAVALHYGDGYRSLGASTAVFAGLGLLAGRAIRVIARSGYPYRWRELLVPLAAGLAVLGLFGAGGVNIDVLAHATGFGAGLAMGFIASGPRKSERPE